MTALSNLVVLGIFVFWCTTYGFVVFLKVGKTGDFLIFFEALYYISIVLTTTFGGWWFIKRNEWGLNCRVEHELTILHYDGIIKPILTIRIHNTGKVNATLSVGHFSAYDTIIEPAQIHQYKIFSSPREISPGGVDVIAYEVDISDLKSNCLSVYTYIENPSYPKSCGWQHYSFHDLRKEIP